MYLTGNVVNPLSGARKDSDGNERTLVRQGLLKPIRQQFWDIYIEAPNKSGETKTSYTDKNNFQIYPEVTPTGNLLRRERDIYWYGEWNPNYEPPYKWVEKITPRKIPNNVAIVPIEKPTIKKIFIIDLFSTPIDFKIAISLVLFLTKIVNPEIILNAATIIIKDSIINITFLSTFKAENNELFISAQLTTNSSSKISWTINFCCSILFGFFNEVQ